jgi:hypothetical protein
VRLHHHAQRLVAPVRPDRRERLPERLRRLLLDAVERQEQALPGELLGEAVAGEDRRVGSGIAGAP